MYNPGGSSSYTACSGFSLCLTVGLAPEPEPPTTEPEPENDRDQIIQQLEEARRQQQQLEEERRQIAQSMPATEPEPEQ
jgi:hypothetical protein